MAEIKQIENNSDEYNIKKKFKVFQKERNEILSKIINIIGLHFIGREFQYDIEKQKKILDLEEDIKKYFSVSNWTAYKSKNKVTDRKRSLSIVKAVLKDMNVQYDSKTYIQREKNKVVSITEYDIHLH